MKRGESQPQPSSVVATSPRPHSLVPWNGNHGAGPLSQSKEKAFEFELQPKTVLLAAENRATTLPCWEASAGEANPPGK